MSTRVHLLALGSLGFKPEEMDTTERSLSKSYAIKKIRKRGMKWKESGNFYIKKKKFTNAFLIIYYVDYIVVNI